MVFALFDRVKETSTTTGTGNLTLAGAVSGYRTFASVFANGDTFYYCIADQTGANWETGIGTFVSATPALARTTVVASSNANAAVNFTVPTFVFVTQIASGIPVIRSVSANAFTVGPNGTTNPAFNVDASAASAVTGINVTANAAGSGVQITSTSSAASENIELNAKGTTSAILIGYSGSSGVPVRIGAAGGGLAKLELTAANLANFAGTLNVAGMTATKPVFTDGSKNIVSGSPISQILLTAQTAAITATLLYAVPASGIGLYRVTWGASITRAATTSSTLGGTTGLQIQYTDSTDSVVKTTNPTSPPISAGNTTATSVGGSFLIKAKASTNINYLMGYTTLGTTTMQYDLSIAIEPM